MLILIHTKNTKKRFFLIFQHDWYCRHYSSWQYFELESKLHTQILTRHCKFYYLYLGNLGFPHHSTSYLVSCLHRVNQTDQSVRYSLKNWVHILENINTFSNLNNTFILSTNIKYLVSKYSDHKWFCNWYHED